MEPRADLILANRAFLDHDVPPGGDAPPPTANGGLLAAVRPVIAPWDGRTGTTWIGAGRGRFDRDWADAEGYELIPAAHGQLRHRRLFFDDVTWAAAYARVSNSFFWPLLHLVRDALPERVPYYPAPEAPSFAEWAGYETVNREFAAAALHDADGQRSCWIHDYHLALVPDLLRKQGFAPNVGFFLHTPFPAIDVIGPYLEGRAAHYFARFVEGLLGADLVGLQSSADTARFCRAASRFANAEPREGGVTTVDGRFVRVAAFPVGIDCDELTDVALAAPLPAEMPDIPPGIPLVVGLERSDYTKGIPERLAVLERAYRDGLRFAYVGVAAPTRTGIPAYASLEAAISDAASRAEAAAREADLPFLHSHAVIEWPGVVALQREASVVFTSSLADGLNLVPLQSAIAQALNPPQTRAVLLTGRDAGVASAFAGFAADGLVPVDPLDAEAMFGAFVDALGGRPGRVSERLIAAVRERDARSWATRFLTALETAC